jgi:hypothetical protein
MATPEGPSATDAPEISSRPSRLQRLQAALDLLLEAYSYARRLNRETAEFAVEIDALRELGVSNSDLRWLVCKGFAQHAHETTSKQHEQRTFQESANLAFTDRTCFVLTRSGATAAKYLGTHSASIPTDQALPYWNPDTRELRFGGQLIKRYRRPSPNQERILAEFQSQGWPEHLEDPLPGSDERDPKQRLRDAIKLLNRHHQCRLIRFHGDGTGQGVYWRALSSAHRPPQA